MSGVTEPLYPSPLFLQQRQVQAGEVPEQASHSDEELGAAGCMCTHEP